MNMNNFNKSVKLGGVSRALGLLQSAVVLILGGGILVSGSVGVCKESGDFDSSRLMLKNAEQMDALVKEKIKLAHNIQAKQVVDYDVGIRAEPEAVDHLKDGLRLVLGRPEKDGTREALFALVRR